MKKRIALALLTLLVFLSSSAFAAKATPTPAPKATRTPKATATPAVLDQSGFPVDGAVAGDDAVLRATAYSRGRIVEDSLRSGLKLTVTGSVYANDGSVWYSVTTKSSKKEGFLPAANVALEAKPTATPKAKATTAPKATAKPADRNNAPIVSRGFIGNQNSKIYHTPTCSHLPNQENQVSFTTKAKAEGEGYRPCGICKP